MIIGLTALYLPAADRAGRFGLVADGLLPLPFDGPGYEVIIGSMAALAGVLAMRSAPAGATDRSLAELSA
jgi:hypothetical protein